VSQSLAMHSIVFGSLLGFVGANMARVPESVSYAVAALGAVVGLGLWYWSGLPNIVGFGAQGDP